MLEPLGLEQFAFVHQLVEPYFEFFFDADDGLFHRGLGGDVVRVGVDADLVECAGFMAGERVDFGDGFQLFAEERHRPCAVVEVGGPDLEIIAAHTKTAALEARVVALVLLGHKISDDFALIVGLANMDVLGHGAVGFHRADAVDARHRGHDDHVIAFE